MAAVLKVQRMCLKLQSKTPVVIAILLVLVEGPSIVDEVPVAVHTLFFIALSCIEDFSMGQHGTPLIWDIEDISVALQALIVLERGISLLTIFLVVIFILGEMNNNVFYPMGCLCIEKIKGVVGGGEMAVHTIRNEPLSVIDMCGCFPGIVGETNFMAPCTELGC